jgi:hypothetical protein
LPFILLIVLAVPWLAARAGRAAPAIAIVLLLSVAMSAREVVAFVRAPDVRLTLAETELVTWLNAQPRPLSVISSNAQILGSMSDTRFYWTTCDSPGETTRAMIRLMSIEYVLLYEHEAQCAFAAQAGAMRLVRVFGTPGRRIFVLQPLR